MPLSDPTATTVSPYFLDDDTQWATYLGDFTFRACHDITAFMGIGRAAASCMSEAQMWDISDPANPQFLWRYHNPAVQPEHIDLFSSAAFSWDGAIVAFGDESGGSGAARCQDPDDDRGRIWFVDTHSGEELASYKIPRSENGICTAHYFQFVPLPRGRKVLVASFLTGGTTIVDVDALLAGASTEAAEIGHYRADGTNVFTANWYNGFLYANDLQRGLDVMMVPGPVTAGARKFGTFNPQTQQDLIQ